MNGALPRIIPLLLLALTLSCTTNQTAIRAKTNLSQDEVVSLANAEAAREGFDLAEYEAPRCSYDPARKDEKWTVFYDGKVKYPGNHFLVWVNDQTSACQLMRGE
jgi:hypothetical protein